MSFKVKINKLSVDAAEATVRATFERVRANKDMLAEIADVIIQDVKFQTRSGKSIPLNKRLDPLGDKWIKKRAQIAKATAVADTFSTRRSNLTVTGQLLDSLSRAIDKVGTVKIFFAGTHAPYRAARKDGQGTYQVGKNLPNDKLAEYVAENGRPFMGVRDSLKPRLNRIVLGYIRRAGKAFGL